VLAQGRDDTQAAVGTEQGGLHRRRRSCRHGCGHVRPRLSYLHLRADVPSPQKLLIPDTGALGAVVVDPRATTPRIGCDGAPGSPNSAPFPAELGVAVVDCVLHSGLLNSPTKVLLC
jgi:hypothetical protein